MIKTALTVPGNVVIVFAPVPVGKVATVLSEKDVIANVLRAVNAAYYNGTL